MKTRILAQLLAVLLAVASHVSIGGAAERSGPESEAALIEVLRSGAPADKAIACKKLAIYGSKEAVPELAKLLTSEELASWARIALEAIPGDAAGAALRESLSQVDGKLEVGVINSIGVRGDAEAVEALKERLADKNSGVAAAAAIALGKIGNEDAWQALRGALDQNLADVKSAVAEGAILCAERRMAEGNKAEAVKIYDAVRESNPPKQRLVEATRGAILARGEQGVSLLVEQLRSDDERLFQIGLSAARELTSPAVAGALANEMEQAAPERAALLLYVLADRPDAVVPRAVFELAGSGDAGLRIAAARVMGRSEGPKGFETLVKMASDESEEVAAAAMEALAGLPGESVGEEIVRRLRENRDQSAGPLIELIGVRRVHATDVLSKYLDHSDASLRRAALAALGETITPEELSLLVREAITPSNPDDREFIARALEAACVRMPDRDATADELAEALQSADQQTQPVFIEILGTMGGRRALDAIRTAVKSGDPQLEDAGSRVLGQWMTLDAAPVLLEMATEEPAGKYRIRALRGYIRLARQFAGTDAQRAEMCRTALSAADRSEEQKLILSVLELYPSPETRQVALEAAEIDGLREDAVRVAGAIESKL